jgi:diguanylate cyclase (GGDEF)-like protein
MPGAHQNRAHLRSLRLLIAAGLAVTIVLCGCVGLAVVGLRNTAWQQANIGAETLLDSLTRTLARDFELYGLSLQAVADRLRDPILEGVSPQVRHLALFDRAATASGYGAIFVLDAQGDAFIDSGSLVPRRLNGADRAYFQVQRTSDIGLYVGRPWRTRITGREMIPLSRRFSYADGTFAGVVVGAIELAYFETVFARLNRNLNLKINVLFDDGLATAGGQLPVQYPTTDPLDGKTLAVIANAEHITLIAPLAGADALHVAHRVGTLPMHVVVSVPISAIDAAWYGWAITIVLIVGTLAIALLFLLLRLRKELQRRTAAEAELAVLALTDALTGIPNRRHFDRKLAELERATSRDRCALALIDVDRFKAFNDHSGHPAGDRVLKAVGAELANCAASAGGIAFRIGGEEFAIVLTGIDETKALDVARICRSSIEALALPHALSPIGIVTVSVGLLYADRQSVATQAEWLSLADAALYEAKRGGRNQVRMIDIITGKASHPSDPTRLIAPEETISA